MYFTQSHYFNQSKTCDIVYIHNEAREMSELDQANVAPLEVNQAFGCHQRHHC